MWILYILSIIGCYFLYQYAQYRKRLAKWRKLYHVRVAQFFPSLPFRIPFFNEHPLNTEPQKCAELMNEYPVHATCTGSSFRVGINDASLAQQVFVTKRQYFNKPTEIYKAVKHMHGPNIVVSKDDGPYWKKHRRFAEPAFSKEKLEYLVKVTHRVTDDLIQFMERKTNNWTESFDIASNLAKLTISIIAIVAWGKELDMFKENPTPLDSNHALSLYETAQVESSTGIFYKAVIPKWARVLLENLPFDNFGKYFRKAHNELFQYLHEFYVERKKDIEDGKSVPDDLMSFFIKGRDDNGNPLSLSEILSNEHVFLIAGHETSSSALGFILYELAKHPEHQQQIYEDVSKIGAEPTLQDYIDGKLSFIKDCIKEGLRLYPPVYVVPKRATKKVTIVDASGKSHKIGKDHLIFANIYAIHRNPLHWGDDATVYRPSRWKKRIVPGAYMPFSLGLRKCIGFEFSYIEVTMIIAKLISRFEFSLDPSYPKDWSPEVGTALTRHAKSVKLCFKPRPKPIF